jgi:hypothetical protein
VLRDPIDLERATASGLTPLVTELGEVYVVIQSEILSGRYFSVGALARFGRTRQ